MNCKSIVYPSILRHNQWEALEKGKMALERIVSELIAYDQIGQDIVRQARENQMADLAHMDEYKREIYTTHREHLECDLARFQQAAAAEQAECLAALERAHLEQLEKLRNIYLQNNDRWVSEMTARCINL